ncbi:prepilin-type N-terminal cleavage/methylation domain-containing protein [Fibrobacter sp. UWOV1]|uniref:type II secretion system protein n=1 Tax=Fibrobacter sp. UWOV1 TaxID=1896215 RepID=UPI00091A9BAF|nr:type II secretion system protein [Fibrobacter sp. UWOV1]SHL65253.1 prepilin-type N-terminal cleavage/methylation domain-containing protein [Fibrobacter sp. UWOV1]
MDIENRKKGRSKRGFTIIELMVVIVIINLLSGVALPQLTGYIERTKEKMDLMKLFYIKNAFERGLYELEGSGGDAVSSAQSTSGFTGDGGDKSLGRQLADKRGMSLLRLDLNVDLNKDGFSRYYAGDITRAMYDTGFYRDVLDAAGINFSSKFSKCTWDCDAWVPPIFKSKALKAKGKYVGAQHIKVKWTKFTSDHKPLSRDVVVWIGDGGGGTILTGWQGTEFVTDKAAWERAK